jgi:hypothetical protein
MNRWREDHSIHSPAGIHSVNESLDRLHRPGWSVGDIATATYWQLDGRNGENLILAVAISQAEAWWKACEQARAMGMLARVRED